MPVLNAFIHSGKFNLTVVNRASFIATFPASVKVTTADFSSVDSVTAAFKGQDAVVLTIGAPGLIVQSVLVDAAIAAGVNALFHQTLAVIWVTPRPEYSPSTKTR